MTQHDVELVRRSERLRFSTWLAQLPWQRRWLTSWPTLWSAYQRRGDCP